MLRLSSLSQIGFLRSTLIVSLLLLGVLVLLPNAWGFPRKVLLEDFTNIGCQPCISLAPALEAAVEETHDIVHLCGVHTQGPDPADPFYGNYPDGHRVRVPYYSITGVPTLIMNGVTYGGARTQQAIAAFIRQQAQAESPLSIVVQGRKTGNTMNVHVVVEAASAVSSSTLHVALVENYSYYPVANKLNDNYGALMRMLPSANGTAFQANAEQIQEFDFQLNMDGVGWDEPELSNMTLLAFVQVNATKEVLQIASYNFPPIDVADWGVTDTQGNNDGRPEPGETSTLILTVENTSEDAQMPTLTATLTCDEELITIDNAQWQIDGIDPGSSVDNSENPFTFTVDEAFEPHAVSFDITFTTEDGAELLVYPIEFTVGWPQFLLIDASNHARAGEEMREMFGENAVLPFADYYNRAEEGMVTAEVLGSYPAVIWFSFNAQNDIFNAWEQEEVIGYLLNGGTFIISSQAFVRTFGQQPIMYRYCCATTDQQDVGQNYFHDFNNNPYFASDSLYFAGGSASNCAGFPDYKPSLSVLEGGNPVLVWGDSPDENLGIAGVEHITATYKTLVLAFPIESLCGFMLTDSRASFMRALLNWHLNAGTGAPVEEANLPARFGLETAFPNPFNSGAVVPFSLSQAGLANVALFDVSGRRVAELHNGTLTPGSHVIHMSGGDLGLVSGYYLVRLQANSQTDIQRILYLK